MNIRCAALIGAVSVASLLHAAETPVEFSGVMTTGGKTRLALTNTATKSTTWVEPGEQFNGYTVARYDAKEDAVFLKKDGRETRLGLVAAKTQESPRPTLTAATTNADATATANAIRANLRQLVAAARQYQIERGVTSVGYSELVGPDKLIKELKPIAGENYSTLTFGPNVTGVSVTTATGSTIALDIPPTGATAAVAPIAAAQPAAAGASVASNPAPLPTTGATPAPAAPRANPVPVPAPIATPAEAAPATAAVPTTLPAASDSSTPTGRQPASPSYTIQGGDTWQKISETTGVPVQRLKELNPAILEGSALPSGQTIRVH
jgi:LysM repeat protein